MLVQCFVSAIAILCFCSLLKVPAFAVSESGLCNNWLTNVTDPCS